MSSDPYIELFDDAVRQIKVHIPKFEIRYKDESWSSKVIAVLVWMFNRDYLKRYTTTRYPKVYFPSRRFIEDSPLSATKILYHEFVHMWDRKKVGVWWSWAYVMPQLLGGLLALAFVVQWFFFDKSLWWVPLAVGMPMLICLLPVPAYWRMKAEMRGYAMSMAFNFWRHGSVEGWTKEWVERSFTGSAYYFMWPFASGVKRRVEKAVSMLEAGSMEGYHASFEENEEPYKLARALLASKGGMMAKTVWSEAN